MTATTELVVPRSMPMILLMTLHSLVLLGLGTSVPRRLAELLRLIVLLNFSVILSSSGRTFPVNPTLDPSSKI
jgi:hypothetical protein